jgi:inosine-uridine nucleoside N-ribohydrolase
MNWKTERIRHRVRIITDNDYRGDPDGLVQLAHHLLCPSVDVRFVIGSAVVAGHPEWTPTCAEESAAAARRIVELTGRSDVPVLPGSNEPLRTRSEAMPSPAAEAIVAEAMRDDTDLPLFVTCGGGLTAVASALLIEPQIADRLTILWIGGHLHPGNESPVDPRRGETNTNIDLTAAQVIFNDTNVALWQVPLEVYGQVQVSRSELLVRMQPNGPLGAHLYDMIGARVDMFSPYILMGETYGLGDSPLVLLTALLGSYDPEPVTSRWTTQPRPRLLDSRVYEANEQGAPARIFTQIDVRLLLEDLYAKLQVHAGCGRGEQS